MLKDEECKKLEQVRDQMCEELEELTAKLFEVCAFFHSLPIALNNAEHCHCGPRAGNPLGSETTIEALRK